MYIAIIKGDTIYSFEDENEMIAYIEGTEDEIYVIFPNLDVGVIYWDGISNRKKINKNVKIKQWLVDFIRYFIDNKQDIAISEKTENVLKQFLRSHAQSQGH